MIKATVTKEHTDSDNEMSRSDWDTSLQANLHLKMATKLKGKVTQS